MILMYFSDGAYRYTVLEKRKTVCGGLHEPTLSKKECQSVFLNLFLSQFCGVYQTYMKSRTAEHGCANVPFRETKDSLWWVG